MSNTFIAPSLMPRVKDEDDGVFSPANMAADSSSFASPDMSHRPNMRRPAHKRHVSGFSLTGGNAEDIDPLELAHRTNLATHDPSQLKRTKSMGMEELEGDIRGGRLSENDDDDNDPSLDDIDNLSQRLASRRVSISSTPGDNDIAQLVGFAVGPPSSSTSSTSASAAPSSPIWGGAPAVPGDMHFGVPDSNPNKVSRKNEDEAIRLHSNLGANSSSTHHHHNNQSPGGIDDDDDDDMDNDNENDDEDEGNGSTEMDGWHLEEDSKLKQLVDKFGKEWKPIAERMDVPEHTTRRSENDCKDRWEQLTKAPYKKGTWTSEEDARLRRLIENVEKRNWGEVASLIPGRSAKQCRERWCYNLDPTINKTPWKPEEDSILMKSQLDLGNKWAKIASMLPGRTENAVKTRFKSIMRAKKREWMPDEDETIMRLHQQLGSRWDAIAEKLPNRSKNAIKTRYRALSKGITSQLPQTGAPNQILRRPEFRGTMTSTSSSSSSTGGAASSSFGQFSGSASGDMSRKISPQGFAAAPASEPHKNHAAADDIFSNFHDDKSKHLGGGAFAAPPKMMGSQNKPPMPPHMKPKIHRDPSTDFLNGIQRQAAAGDFNAPFDTSSLDLFSGKSSTPGPNSYGFANNTNNHHEFPPSSVEHHEHQPTSSILGNFTDSHGSFEDILGGKLHSKSRFSSGWSYASGSHPDLLSLHHSDSRGQLAGTGFGSGSGAMQGLDRAGLSGSGFRTVQEVEETFMHDDDVPLQDDELVDFLNMWDQSAPPAGAPLMSAHSHNSSNNLNYGNNNNMQYPPQQHQQQQQHQHQQNHPPHHHQPQHQQHQQRRPM
mmetsp:Transcript_23229/g.40994  ORF Transcript_23229/g.40994 Transcript_23229/m.40994 type:complete len:828 (+) Transcript_23229:960-3443(+)